MTALAIVALVLAFIAWKVAKLAAVLMLVTLALFVWLGGSSIRVLGKAAYTKRR